MWAGCMYKQYFGLFFKVKKSEVKNLKELMGFWLLAMCTNKALRGRDFTLVIVLTSDKPKC